jgi:peptidyl-prolyl cis-trans isomerase C
MLTFILLGFSLTSTGVQSQNTEILARVGGKTITTADLNRIIGFYDQNQQNEIAKNPQIRESLLWQIIRSTVVAQLARKKGFDKKPEIRYQQEMLINNLLATLYLQKEVVEKVSITDEKARAYYKTHTDSFQSPEMARVKHILIKTESSASEKEKQTAKTKAEEALKKLKGGEDFAKLASEISDDPGTKDKGGELDFFPRGSMIPAFEEAAFALKPGEISGLVETEYGFHLIKMEEKKEALLEPYEKVQDKVKEQALEEMRKAAVSDFLEKAMKNANVEVKPGQTAKPKN